MRKCDSETPVELFVMRIGDLEVRTCDINLADAGPHCRTEIVKHQGDSCIAIAHWVRHSEGFDLKFICDWPFRYADVETFWRIAKAGHEHMKAYFNRLEGPF